MDVVASFPAEPEVPPSQCASGHPPVRYEDISQDGRVKPLALPPALGAIVWQQSVRASAALTRLQHEGVVPILTRFVIEGGQGPVSVRRPLSAQGCYQLAHTVDERGVVDRIMLNMWLRLAAPLARTHGPPPPRAGELVGVGRVFGEHVFTRAFAPPAQRKVLRLDVPGLPPVPPDRYLWRPPVEMLVLPPGARPLDAAPVPDPVVHVFGLTHTDSNQHVNSLVYPRLFEEAVLRRLAAHGRSSALLARFAEVGYRKPCFVGNHVRILVQAFEDAEGVGAVGVYVPEADLGARPYCYLRMRLG